MKVLLPITILFLNFLELKAQAVDGEMLLGVHAVNTSEMNSITGMVVGSILYNTDSGALFEYNGISWLAVDRKNLDTFYQPIDSLKVRADSTIIYQGIKTVSSVNNPRVYMGKFIISSTGNMSITGLPFKPSAIDFKAVGNVETYNQDSDNQVGNNNTGLANSFNYMFGFAQDIGGSISQQVICGGGSGNSINDISRYSSSSECIGIRYANQNGDALGYTRARLNSFDSNGFTINVTHRSDNLVVIYSAYR